MNPYAHLEATSVRRLKPQDTVITDGDHGMMTCAISGEAERHGVFASMLFPITHPEQFISLRYTDAEEKERELGVIERLADFPSDVVERVRASLVKQYHEQIIRRVVKIKCKWGQLFITVETQRGTEEIVMPWRQDRAEDYGTSGKVLLDSLNNRYVLPDVDALSAKEQRVFRNFIYW
jgi:hypothetical protein